MFFANRVDAGRRLAAALTKYRDRFPVVLGLPRGGVPVAFEVAHALEAPLDVLAVRKIGAPDQPELAIGAVAQGATVIDGETLSLLGISEDYVHDAVAHARAELDGLLARLRGAAPPVAVLGRPVILVDDGIATGATARAAVQAARALGAREVVVAAPACSPEARRLLETTADAVVCLETPEPFIAVGYWYADFAQTTDREVRDLLRLARLERDVGYHAVATP